MFGDQDNISIHAPAKERQSKMYLFSTARQISIHAPAKERHVKHFIIKEYSNFNPRSCEGATNQFIIKPEAVNISIHAPAKERLQNCTKIPFVLSFLLDNYTHSILFKQAFPFAFTSNHSDFHVFLVRIS